jgi:hypothetical protein
VKFCSLHISNFSLNHTVYCIRVCIDERPDRKLLRINRTPQNTQTCNRPINKSVTSNFSIRVHVCVTAFYTTKRIQTHLILHLGMHVFLLCARHKLRITGIHSKTVRVKLIHLCQMSCANKRWIPIEVLRIWEVCFYYSLIITIVEKRRRPTVHAARFN